MNLHVIPKDRPAPEPQSRTVEVRADLWAPLVRHCIKQGITVETAAAEFIRDGLEGPFAR